MVKYKGYTPEPKKPGEIDGVPTADGLVEMGPRYARRVAGGILVTDEGHALMTAASIAKGKAARDRGEGDWVQPPSRNIPGLRNQ